MAVDVDARRHLGPAGSWAWFSQITGFVLATSFIALSSGSGGPATILVVTAAVVLVWAWLTAISIKLYREA